MMASLTSYWTLNAVVLPITALVIAYFYVTRNFNYWKKRGVFEIPPTPFIGNFGDCCLLRMSVPRYLKFLYEQGKGLPYVGFYVLDKPALVLRDPEIIKCVLVKDFNSFSDRHASSTEADVLGTSNLFFLKNPVWKNLRHKLTAAFSSGKMRAMFPLVKAVGNDLADHLESLHLEGNGLVVELKEVCARYTTDIIGSCVFGLHANSLKNPEAEFRKYGRIVFDANLKRGLEMVSLFFIPSIVRPLGLVAFPAGCGEFFRKAFWDSLNERLKLGLHRDDLIDILIKLKNNKTDNDDLDAFACDGDNLVAQAAIFFSAGFESSSTMISFALHELSLQPDIQTELRGEIRTALEENSGELTYEMMQQLPYLDKIAWETLRKYPTLPFLDREATCDYTIAKTGLIIEKGTPIHIPLLGLHYDPEYFPEPDIFDPERFSDENKRKQQPYAYMPFGEGPRNCIGLRFGLMVAKLGIIEFIRNYEIIPCEETLIPVRYNQKSVFTVSEGGMYHRLRRIKTMDG